MAEETEKKEPDNGEDVVDDEGAEAPSELSEIDKAHAAVDKMNDAAAKLNKAADRYESLKAKEVLRDNMGGRSQAGQQLEKKELTPAEYKDSIMRGEIPNEAS